MTTTPRTVSPLAWAEASSKIAIKPGEITETVNKCMAELDQAARNTGRNNYRPWLNTGGRCYGAIWAGVPAMAGYQKDCGGSWLVGSPGPLGQTPIYVGLSPAPPDAEVQYGFCHFRMDAVQEWLTHMYGSNSTHPPISNVTLSVGRNQGMRADKVVSAAVKLSRSRSCRGKRFRTLLGKRKLSNFIECLLGGVMAECSGNILCAGNSGFRMMAGLVVYEAYPDLASPSLEDRASQIRFRTAFSACRDLYSQFPLVCSVIMPVPIFEEVSRNLELGIPPIVPQYATPTTWMFNGSWSEPCTGLTMEGSVSVSREGQKIVGGMTNAFNCDLPGRASYWPFDKNPPVEWVTAFVDQLKKLREEQLPPYDYDRIDLALSYTQGVPVVLDMKYPDESRALRYSKLVSLDTDDNTGYITRIETRECDASGEYLTPSTANSTEGE
jgi:hypothetical protein